MNQGHLANKKGTCPIMKRRRVGLYFTDRQAKITQQIYINQQEIHASLQLTLLRGCILAVPVAGCRKEMLKALIDMMTFKFKEHLLSA